MSATTVIVSQLMHQPVVTVGPGARVDEVMALAQSKAVHHIPIVKAGRLLGIVCTCDLTGARPDSPALQLARRNVITAQPDCSADEAARLMMTNAVGSLVISNRDGLWGIVTRKDLMRSDAKLANLLKEVHCAACQAEQHLRPGPGETLLCVNCLERANATHWFDEGAGG